MGLILSLKRVTAAIGKEIFRYETLTYVLDSDGISLTGHLAVPNRVRASGTAGLVLCHGFPSGSSQGIDDDRSYYDFADLVAKALGWVVLAFTYRGCGGSEGEFSLNGWLDDTICAATKLKNNPQVNSVWLAGFGTGGALAISAASLCDEVSGAASISAPSDFHDWALDPDRLLQYSRTVGAITDPDFPQDKKSWAEEIDLIRPLEAAEKMSGKPLLVVHGASDQVVPSFDARVIADAHGNADLRIIEGGTHRLRFDPRASAIIIGWLDRTQRLATKEMTSDQYSVPEGES